jgi:hypothetical protein
MLKRGFLPWKYRGKAICLQQVVESSHGELTIWSTVLESSTSLELGTEQGPPYFNRLGVAVGALSTM